MNTGFTLVEILVALAIFALLSAAVLSSQLSTVQANTQTETRLQGQTAARQTLERLRGRGTLPTSGTEEQQVSVGRTYKVTTAFCPSTNDPPCTANAIHVRVTASYNNKDVAQVDSVFTQVNGGYSTGGGN